jgi:hypothetical protein
MGSSAGSLSFRQGGVKAMAGQPNLRQQQRVPTTLDVTVTGRAGESLDCHTANLSRAGMSIECDRKRINALASDRWILAPKSPAEVTVRLTVPIENVQSVTLEVVCNIIYIRRISHKVFHLGLQFVEFSGSGQEYVDQYVSRSLNG